MSEGRIQPCSGDQTFLAKQLNHYSANLVVEAGGGKGALLVGAGALPTLIIGGVPFQVVRREPAHPADGSNQSINPSETTTTTTATSPVYETIDESFGDERIYAQLESICDNCECGTRMETTSSGDGSEHSRASEQSRILNSFHEQTTSEPPKTRVLPNISLEFPRRSSMSQKRTFREVAKFAGSEPRRKLKPGNPAPSSEPCDGMHYSEPFRDYPSLQDTRLIQLRPDPALQVYLRRRENQPVPTFQSIRRTKKIPQSSSERKSANFVI